MPTTSLQNTIKSKRNETVRTNAEIEIDARRLGWPLISTLCVPALQTNYGEEEQKNERTLLIIINKLQSTYTSASALHSKSSTRRQASKRSVSV